MFRAGRYVLMFGTFATVRTLVVTVGDTSKPGAHVHATSVDLTGSNTGLTANLHASRLSSSSSFAFVRKVPYPSSSSHPAMTSEPRTWESAASGGGGEGGGGDGGGREGASGGGDGGICDQNTYPSVQLPTRE